MWVFWNNISQRRGAHGTSAPNLQLAVGPPYNVRDPASFHRLSAPPPPPLMEDVGWGGGLWGMRVFGGEEMGTFWPKRGIFFMIRQPPPQPRREGCCLEGGFGGSCFMVRIGALWVCKGMGMVASQEVYVRPAGPLSGAPWTGAGRCPETYCLEPSRGFLWIPRKFIRKK